jgi:hypothetical protein
MREFRMREFIAGVTESPSHRVTEGEADYARGFTFLECPNCLGDYYKSYMITNLLGDSCYIF